MAWTNKYKDYLDGANKWVERIRRGEGLEVNEIEKALKFLETGEKLLRESGNEKKANILQAEIDRLKQIERIEIRAQGVSRYIENTIRKLVRP